MSDKKDDGGLASPGTRTENFGPFGGQDVSYPGETRRQILARTAMLGFLANGAHRRINKEIQLGAHADMLNDVDAMAAAVNEQIAYFCYKLADSMIAFERAEAEEKKT